MSNMNDEQTELLANRLLDLENVLRRIDLEHWQLTRSSVFKPNKDKMLAFRYHLKYKELYKTRQQLGWPEPRKEPGWVRKHTEDSIIQYVSFGE